MYDEIMDEMAEIKSARAEEMYASCVHAAACDRANEVLDGNMLTFDALRCDECDCRG